MKIVFLLSAFSIAGCYGMQQEKTPLVSIAIENLDKEFEIEVDQSSKTPRTLAQFLIKKCKGHCTGQEAYLPVLERRLQDMSPQDQRTFQLDCFVKNKRSSNEVPEMLMKLLLESAEKALEESKEELVKKDGALIEKDGSLSTFKKVTWGSLATTVATGLMSMGTSALVAYITATQGCSK